MDSSKMDNHRWSWSVHKSYLLRKVNLLFNFVIRFISPSSTKFKPYIDHRIFALSYMFDKLSQSFLIMKMRWSIGCKINAHMVPAQIPWSSSCTLALPSKQMCCNMMSRILIHWRLKHHDKWFASKIWDVLQEKKQKRW